MQLIALSKVIKTVGAITSLDDLIKIKNFVSTLIQKKKTNTVIKTRANIMMDLAFTIETEKAFEDLTQEEILSAINKRLISLALCWDKEAIGYVDEYTIEDD